MSVNVEMKSAVLLALLTASVPLVGHAQRAQPAAKTGSEIRIVDLKALDAAIAQRRGKAILVNFWAMWCEPCVAELPELLATGREYRAQNAVVLTVSYDLMIPDVTKEQVLKEVRAFAARRRIDAPVFIYDAPDYDAINARFGLGGPVPVTVAIDATGRIVDRHEGQATRTQFRRMMQKAITRNPPGSGPTPAFPSPSRTPR